MLFSLLTRSPAVAAGGRSFSLLSKSKPALNHFRITASYYGQTQAISRRSFLTSAPALATVKETVVTKTTTTKAKPARTSKAAGAGAKKKPAAAGTKKKSTAVTKKKLTRRVVAKKPKKKIVAKKRKVVKKKKAVKPKPKKVLVKEITPPFKGPGTMWTLFVKAFMKDKEPLHFIKAHQEAAQVWRTMSESEKQAYRPDPAVVEGFLVKRREWVKNLDPRQRRAYRARHKTTRRSGRLSSYALFVQDHWQTLPEDLKFGEKSKMVAQLYKNLSDDEKHANSERAAKINEERFPDNSTQASATA